MDFYTYFIHVMLTLRPTLILQIKQNNTDNTNNTINVNNINNTNKAK